MKWATGLPSPIIAPTASVRSRHKNATGRTAKPFVKRRKPRTPTIKIAMLIYEFSARLCRNAMAGVAKRLRHWIVVPVFGGSIPLVCPIY